ncbi:MAG: SDR family oxidoreductase [Haloferacaceae archaeon]
MRAVVFGCGYVGLTLGARLRDAGHDVVGVRRSGAGLDAVREAGIEAVRADATDPDDVAAVPDADWVVYAASAGRGGGLEAARSVYVDGLTTVVDDYAARDDPPSRLVYASSTGVYGDCGGDWVDESTPPTPDTPRGEVLLEAERVALERTAAGGIDGTVVRFGGLYGPGRYRLERYLEGPVTEGYRNLTHRDDAAGAVAHLLAGDRARGEVVLVVDDEPVSKWEFADWLADECGVERPPKRTVAERLAELDDPADLSRRVRASKRCSNRRLRELDYEFRYPTYREGYRPAIDAYRESGAGEGESRRES